MKLSAEELDRRLRNFDPETEEKPEIDLEQDARQLEKELADIFRTLTKE